MIFQTNRRVVHLFGSPFFGFENFFKIQTDFFNDVVNAQLILR